MKVLFVLLNVCFLVSILSSPLPDSSESPDEVTSSVLSDGLTETSMAVDALSDSTTKETDSSSNWANFIPLTVNKSIPTNEVASSNSSYSDSKSGGAQAFENFIPEMAGNFTKYSDKPDNVKTSTGTDGSSSEATKLGLPKKASSMEESSSSQTKSAACTNANLEPRFEFTTELVSQSTVDDFPRLSESTTDATRDFTTQLTTEQKLESTTNSESESKADWTWTSLINHDFTTNPTMELFSDLASETWTKMADEFTTSIIKDIATFHTESTSESTGESSTLMTTELVTEPTMKLAAKTTTESIYKTTRAAIDRGAICIGDGCICPEDPVEGDFGLYSDPDDCSKFYHCSNGVAIRKDCPANLHFNPILLVCDYPISTEISECKKSRIEAQ